jgi:hypothetical protein
VRGCHPTNTFARLKSCRMTKDGGGGDQYLVNHFDLLHNSAFSRFSGTQKKYFVVATCNLFSLSQLSINLCRLIIPFHFYDRALPTANGTHISERPVNQ